MISADEIERSKQIQRSTGRTFHLATRLFPPRVRQRTYVLYAFFRLADQIVDDADTDPPEEQLQQLDHFQRMALGEEATEDPVLSAFTDIREECGIDDTEIIAFIDAMRQDVIVDRYRTYAHLERYMRGSAVAVAHMMLAVMEPDDPRTARPHAQALGEAFQLTNFLRDVNEDFVQLNRIYLPQDTLARFGVEPADFAASQASERFAAAIASELRRAEARYHAGVAGITYLPQRCQFPVLLAAVLYAEHHRLIRRQAFDVLSKRPSLSLSRSLWVITKTMLWWIVQRDPTAVFYRASPIEPPRETMLRLGEHPTLRERVVGVVRSVLLLD